MYISKMSQDLVSADISISSFSSNNNNNSSNNSSSSSSPSMQDLMSLLSDQSKVISGLQRTIEVLNDTIKCLNDKILKMEDPKYVDKNVSGVVKVIPKEVSKTSESIDINNTTCSKNVQPNHLNL